MSPDAGVTWLSGVVNTFFNKVVFPTLWGAMLVGIPLWLLSTTGRIALGPDLRFMAVFVLAVSLPLAWFVVHLQLVGYRGRELVVANFWREARIPFEHIDAVEGVWWYRGRLVAIRFKSPNEFGTTVYYLPKWDMFRTIFSHPEEQLRRAMAAAVVESPPFQQSGAQDNALRP